MFTLFLYNTHIVNYFLNRSINHIYAMHFCKTFKIYIFLALFKKTLVCDSTHTDKCNDTDICNDNDKCITPVCIHSVNGEK